ncbi:MAG TPA: mandelate racemase/muconate lactonizing enzyme family protein [Arenicellales bacterium]|jgi:2-dehydro-3-deoxyphosphogalactonate aldolase|nr:isomerase [Gammaproteobacteria bacterium]MDP6025698.1 mandelate racemase/muconate lactonizing enzyme family protein [Pseudomonadales bacterium]HJL51583.1 mandelate racemase/muconate lactonizing enzyme family protein [Arenicellales bacterium]MDP6314813.1 mandelate racemase/muconate lactonizing enzyme family protein [Pseudomonadales bacterium]MDP7313785.1 mandelate racemase/muconate lactonizing enzyme family protein [Pseudomonadales bacterium]|tara:strand:+ start:1761 stop:2957 length:1197 start_codon:yes stop_codon:yes gene_type:complete
MKLANIKSYVIKTDPPNTGGLFWFFVKLETDNGHEGWGETAILYTLLGVEDGYEKIVSGAFDTYLKGEDPLNREALYQKLYIGLTAQHPDYIVMGIISAFDVALWDICGKYYDTPVYNLLGGKYRDRVRTYTYIYDREKTDTIHEALGAWTTDPERLAELAVDLADEGFTGLKFDPMPQAKWRQIPTPPWESSLAELDHAENAVKAIRQAVGNRADILIGTHGQITPSAARRLAARIEKYDPLWLEEPCPPENYKEMGKIARSTTIPIASGERLTTVFEFQNLFEQGGCAFAQPDLGSCGGITACRKIAALAEANYIQMAPHVWGGPIITAAALQIDANIPNFLIQESIYKSGGFFNEIIKEPFTWEDGDLIPSDRPGVGIELDETKLETYRGRLSDL